MQAEVSQAEKQAPQLEMEQGWDWEEKRGTSICTLAKAAQILGVN